MVPLWMGHAGCRINNAANDARCSSCPNFLCTFLAIDRLAPDQSIQQVYFKFSGGSETFLQYRQCVHAVRCDCENCYLACLLARNLSIEMGRVHPCCSEEKKVRKGLWSPEEDERLASHIARFGVSCWSSIPELAGDADACIHS